MAQQPSGGALITYSLIMADGDDLPSIDAPYQPRVSACFTRLYQPEMKRYTEAFLSHVRTIRSVRSYDSSLGFPAPRSLGDDGFMRALELSTDPAIERIGGMYFAPTSKVNQITFDGTRITSSLWKWSIEDDQLMKGSDTVYTENVLTGMMDRVVIENKADLYASVSGAGFSELWMFDKNKGAFEKDVRFLSLLTKNLDPDSKEFRGQQFLLCFKAGKFNKRNIAEARLVRSNIETNVYFNRDFNIDCETFESEGLARTSDSYSYIEPTERYDLMTNILQAVQGGQVQVLHFDGIDFNEAKAPVLTREDFFKRLERTDTVYTEDLATGEMEVLVITMQYALSDVVGFRFFEDWYMDHDNMAMYKRVKGMVLLHEVKDENTGEVKGVGPINNCYLKLNPKM